MNIKIWFHSALLSSCFFCTAVVNCQKFCAMDSKMWWIQWQVAKPSWFEGAVQRFSDFGQSLYLPGYSLHPVYTPFQKALLGRRHVAYVDAAGETLAPPIIHKFSATLLDCKNLLSTILCLCLTVLHSTFSEPAWKFPLNFCDTCRALFLCYLPLWKIGLVSACHSSFSARHSRETKEGKDVKRPSTLFPPQG